MYLQFLNVTYNIDHGLSNPNVIRVNKIITNYFTSNLHMSVGTKEINFYLHNKVFFNQVFKWMISLKLCYLQNSINKQRNTQ